MDILIIGGTQFVGRALVESALARGHKVTLFNRGKTNPDLFPQAERIAGDRMEDLDKLGDGPWDVVIDTVGYTPQAVKLSVDYLKDKVQHYVFISTISVYDMEKLQPGFDESGTLIELDGPEEDAPQNSLYGGRKVLCERAIEAVFPGHNLIIRPGLIVGPYDPTNRYPYWVGRIAKGGEVLLPDAASQPVQWVDARDLANFTLDMTEALETGIYNVTGPDRRLTFGEYIDYCERVGKASVSLRWTDPDWLLENEVTPFMEMPMWVPQQMMNPEVFMGVNVDKAINAGLKFRPQEETMQDTLDWLNSLDGEVPGAAGLDPEKEQALLAKLDA
ncbi:NAD-dependent epimerase/dehydratase family protein [Phototrophicus methaneseepsis]|uniref:NAD-dependent epimerase/dehydratase family protein n=1 Tax=Phototrophicus methaneseepsis TaxID=2710758 RepID=A0A7S8E9E2_9CHLR|nr:NAD-dependent epimerase/dehydratase family protein [Phototrophicus methaneseepsis]QPC82775.1 NAD-dependent epimerase/dehydratase family protein [Phototrophicus methaneseepsis]